MLNVQNRLKCTLLFHILKKKNEGEKSEKITENYFLDKLSIYGGLKLQKA